VLDGEGANVDVGVAVGAEMAVELGSTVGEAEAVASGLGVAEGEGVGGGGVSVGSSVAVGVGSCDAVGVGSTSPLDVGATEGVLGASVAVAAGVVAVAVAGGSAVGERKSIGAVIGVATTAVGACQGGLTVCVGGAGRAAVASAATIVPVGWCAVSAGGAIGCDDGEVKGDAGTSEPRGSAAGQITAITDGVIDARGTLVGVPLGTC
jgi:hypothetical protein